MSTIFVCGASFAGVKAAQDLQKKCPNDTVVLYSLDGSAPISQEGIKDVLANAKTMKAIECDCEGITVVTDQNVSRINLNRKRLYLESKEQIPFDQLVLTDTGSWRLPDIKGTNKNGSFVLKSRKDLEKFLDQVLLADDIVVQTDRLEGLLYALALTKRERTLSLVYSGKSMIPTNTDPEVQEAFVQWCESQNLKVYLQTTIDEILGDSDLKAVRLSNQKVLAAQCVLFTQARLDVRIFSEAPELRHGLLDVNDKYLTTVNDIYALGDAISVKTLTEAEQAQQAEQCANVMAGESFVAENVYAETIFQAENMSWAQLGKIETGDGITETVYFQKDPFVYKKFFVQHNGLKGAILVNCPEDQTRVQEYIQHAQPIEGKLDQFALPEVVAQGV